MIDFVSIPSVWHDLVQWSAFIPRVTLALQGQEDHRLVATQVAFQPKPTVAVVPSTFIRATPSEILKQSKRYSSATTVCRLSHQGVVPPLLSSFFPSWRALPWRPLPGRADRGLLSRHGRFCSSFLRRDARALPQYDDAAAVFSVWPSQLGTGDHRLHFAMWHERHFACRADCQPWLLQQTERISNAAESGDLRPFWSLFRALQGKRRRLVPRPVLDDAGNPATEPSRVAELMAGALLYGVWPQGQGWQGPCRGRRSRSP